MNKLFEISVVVLLLSGYASTLELTDLDQSETFLDGKINGDDARNDDENLFIFDQDLVENFGDPDEIGHSIFRRDAEEQDTTGLPDLEPDLPQETGEDSGDNERDKVINEQINGTLDGGNETEPENKPENLKKIQNEVETPTEIPALPGVEEKDENTDNENKDEATTVDGETKENDKNEETADKNNEEPEKTDENGEIKVEADPTTIPPTETEINDTTEAPLEETTTKMETTRKIETTTAESVISTTTTEKIEAPQVPDSPKIELPQEISTTEKEPEIVAAKENGEESKFAQKTENVGGKGKSVVNDVVDNEANNSTKTGESKEEPSTAGSKDTSILIFLFAAVVLIGLLAFAYNFIKKRRQRNADLERVERGPSAIKRSLQSLTKAVNEEEMKPLTGEIAHTSETKGYAYQSQQQPNKTSNGDAKNQEVEG